MADYTFRSEPNPEANVCDGMVGFFNAVAWSWDEMVDNPNYANDTVEYGVTSIGSHPLIQNGWTDLRRGITIFNIASLPSEFTIITATVSFYGYEKGDTFDLGDEPKIGLYSCLTESDISLTDEDANTLGVTAISDDLFTIDSWNDEGWNTFTLNAIGKALLTGDNVKMVLRFNYDVLDTAPRWSSGDSLHVEWRSADYGDHLLYAPKLEINTEVLTAGYVWVEGSKLHYTTASGERSFEGALV